MRVRNLSFTAAALCAGLLVTACNKTPAPAPGTQPATQPAAASASAGTPATPPTAAGAPASSAAAAPVTAPTVATAPAVAPPPAASVEPARPVKPAAPVVSTLVVPAGTSVSIRTNQSLSGEHDDVGTTFGGSLNSPVTVRGTTVFPRGTEVRGEITSAKGRGRFKGAGYIGIALTSIGGHSVQTSEYSVREKGRGKRTGTFIGGGAGLGALIGGLAGGGKGALIGGLSGAGAGTAAGAMTGSRDVVIPAESLVTFTTRSTITVKK